MGNIKVIIDKDINKITDTANNNTRWIYLGSNISVRRKINELLGEKNRYYIDGEIQDVARREQKPFLNLIAKLGTLQRNQVFWWASSLSYKQPFSSSLFTFICYSKFLKKIFRDKIENNKFLLIVIDDIWLYKDIQKQFSNCSGISFESKLINFRLVIDIVKLFIRGLLARILFFIKIISAKVIIDRNKNVESTICFYSWIENRSFQNGQFNDPYLGNLGKILNLESVTYIVPILLNKDLKKECKKLQTPRFIFLDSFVRYWDVLLAITAIFLPKFDEQLMVNRTLIWREVLHVFSNAFFNTNVLNYYVFSNYFKSNKKLKVVIYPYENQPYEKMICLAKRQYNYDFKVIGYQHASVPKLLNNYFLGCGEEDIIPFPNYIFTCGTYTLELLRKHGNYPAGTALINGGALRYTHLNTEESLSEHTPLKMVLVSLTYIPELTESMLELLFRDFENCSEVSNLLFYIKFHPDFGYNQLSEAIPKVWPSHFRIVDRPIKELLTQVDLVIYSSSTVGLEAVISGKKILKYQSETLLDLDPLDGYEGMCIDKCFDRNFKEKILIKLSECECINSSKTKELGKEYFSSINDNNWLRLIEGNKL